MNLGQFIKERRKEIGLTLEQLGKKVGVSKMTISRWESGEIKNMKSDKLEKLANALGIPVIALFDGWDENGNKIESEQVTPQEFKQEVTSLLNKTINLSEQQKQYLLNTLDLLLSSDKE